MKDVAFVQQGPPLWRIGAFGASLQRRDNTDQEKPVEEQVASVSTTCPNKLFVYSFDGKQSGVPLDASKGLQLKKSQCYIVLRVFREDADNRAPIIERKKTKNEKDEKQEEEKEEEEKDEQEDEENVNATTTTTTTSSTKLKRKSNDSPRASKRAKVVVPSLSLGKLAKDAEQVITPRGLSFAFGSLPRDSLSGSLFSSHQKSNGFQHELYLWNGTKANEVVRAACLSKCFELERLLASSDTAVQSLFDGTWPDAERSTLCSIMDDLKQPSKSSSSKRNNRKSDSTTSNGERIRVNELLRRLARDSFPSTPGSPTRHQRLIERAPPKRAMNAREKPIKHARIAATEAVTLGNSSSSSSSSSTKRKARPSRPTKRTSTGHNKANSTTLPAPRRPFLPALTLGKLPAKTTDSLEDEKPQRGRGAGRAFKSLKLPSTSGMLSAIQNSAEPVVNPNKYSKSELLRLYDTVCSKILDWMFLGSRCPAMSRDQLKSFGITHVLNCAGTIVDNYFPDEFEYKTLALVDGGSEDLECLFAHVLEWFEDIRANNQRVYVHCHAGISRSSSFVIAYLMWSNGWPFLKAHEFTKAIRATVSPNGGFIGQLLQWSSRIKAPPQARLCRVMSHSCDPDFLVPKHVKTISAEWLDPRTCMLLQTPETMYAWHGAKALPKYKDACVKIHRHLARFENAPKSLTTVEQGEESDAFWSALGGKRPVSNVADWNRDYSPTALAAKKPNSLLLRELIEDEDAGSSSSARAMLYLYPNNFLVDTATASDFERLSDPDDLESNCLYILISEKKDTVFGWVGDVFKPPGGEPREQFALDALKRFVKLHNSMFEDDVKMVMVQQKGNAPGNETFWDEFDKV